MSQEGRSGSTRPRIDRQTKRRMQELRDQQVPVQAIAIRLGVRQSTVYLHTKRAR